MLASICNWPTNPEQRMQIWSCLQLLSTIYTNCHSVVVDENGEIFDEYKRFMRREDSLAKWFISMSNEPRKFISRPRAHFELDIAFDPDDLKFLEVAINSPHRIIVTCDSDFLKIRNEEQIRDNRIRILTVEEALREL